jgi:hypothetical protein
VCTNSAIKQGQLIAEYVGEYIDAHETKSIHLMRVPSVEFHTTNDVRRFTSLCIDAMVQGNITRFCEHSCDPNASVVSFDVEHQRRMVLVAMKDITPEPDGLLKLLFFTPILSRRVKKAATVDPASASTRREPDADHQPAQLLTRPHPQDPLPHLQILRAQTAVQQIQGTKEQSPQHLEPAIKPQQPSLQRNH